MDYWKRIILFLAIVILLIISVRYKGDSSLNDSEENVRIEKQFKGHSGALKEKSP